jgi:outer membrane protein assembly factor BamB
VKYLTAVALAMSVAFVACAKKAPLTPATPWADVLGDALCFFTVATDPGGLKVQYVFDWGNGDTAVTGYYKSGDTAHSARVFRDTGTFHIKVRARNEQGRASKWSDECLFHASMPPQLVDTIVGFPRWAVDRWYRPAVKVTDPDGDSVSVKFIWNDSTASNWSPFVASGSVVSDSVRWSTEGRRVLRVALKDQSGMVNQSAGVKAVTFGKVGVVWYTPENAELGSLVSPAMGEIDGERVLYVDVYDGIACLYLDGSVRWETAVGWGPSFGPSLSNDGSRLYLADDGEMMLYSLDTRTGRVIWQFAYPLSECSGTPAVGPDGSVYLQGGVADSGTSFVMRIRDCGDSARLEWRVPFPVWPSLSGWGVVIGTNGTIYACCGIRNDHGGVIVALDTAGAVLWLDSTHIARTDWLYAPVTDSRGRVILGDDSGNLLCFNPDGTLAWLTNVEPLIYHGGITIGFDDRIYCQSDAGRLYCIDSDGNWVWAQYMPDDAYGYTSPCLLSDSTILVSCGEAKVLTCFSWEGEVLWSYNLMDSVETGRHGSKDEGDGDGAPAIGPDGLAYVGDDYFFYCFSIGNAGLANTAWPTYNHDNARSGWAGRPQPRPL